MNPALHPRRRGKPIQESKKNRRPNTEEQPKRRVMAVGRRVKDGWLIRTNLQRYQEENETPVADDGSAAA